MAFQREVENKPCLQCADLWLTRRQHKRTLEKKAARVGTYAAVGSCQCVFEMGKLAITRSEGSRINVGGGGIIIHKTDARNVKDSNGASADLDRLTLKNTEDVKKSCVSGSNRSRPISEAREKDGYSRRSHAMKWAMLLLRRNGAQWRCLNTGLGLKWRASLVHSCQGWKETDVKVRQHQYKQKNSLKKKTDENWGQRGGRSAGRGSAADGGSRPRRWETCRGKPRNWRNPPGGEPGHGLVP